jgi:DNA polymerase I-like protein with 3'-5' exonuclease and polymerase domains
MCLNGFYLNPGAWRELIESNKTELIETIKTLDEYFLPIVGSNVPPDADHMAALEKTWRDLDNKSPEEIDLGVQLRAEKDKAAKEQIKVKRVALEAERKERKAAAREAYMTVQKQATAWKNEAKTWEGDACINYNSPAQIHEALLKGKFGFTEKNLPNTNKQTLEKHAGKPVVKVTRRYRKLKKLIGTYGESWLNLRTDPKEPGYADPDTGRIHARHNQMGTETGRGSCSDPNLQNIPKEDKYRACFQARPHYKICTVDFNGQELRIATELSGEVVWITAFKKGWDVHSVCAEILYEKEWKSNAVHEPYWTEIKGVQVLIPKCAFYYESEKHPTAHQKCECPGHQEMRSWLKNVNFGVIYGKGAFALAADLEIELDTAEGLLLLFATSLKHLWSYLEKTAEQTWMRGEARTMSQRRRLIDKDSKRLWAQSIKKAREDKKIPDHLPVPDWQVRSAYNGIVNGIKRQGKNTPIQGTGADMAKLAFGCGFDQNGKPYLWQQLEPDFGGYQVNAVHDEGVAEVPDSPEAEVSPFYIGPGITEGNAHRAFEVIQDCMERAGQEFVKTIPTPTEGHVDTRWRK